jgi:hypothetical protein
MEWLYGLSMPTVCPTDIAPRVNTPDVGSVYLAGSWNNWANNNNGYVNDQKFLMTAAGGGQWKTSVPLTYGQWFFKIVTDNNRWWSPSGFPLDHDGNAIFWIDDNGVVLSNPGVTDSKSMPSFLSLTTSLSCLPPILSGPFTFFFVACPFPILEVGSPLSTGFFFRFSLSRTGFFFRFYSLPLR